MNKIRVGVVGLGRLGFTHAENISTTKKSILEKRVVTLIEMMN